MDIKKMGAYNRVIGCRCEKSTGRQSNPSRRARRVNRPLKGVVQGHCFASLAMTVLLLVLALFGTSFADPSARKAMLYPSSGGSKLMISGSDIEIAVNDEDGRFTIGYKGKVMLFGFPGEGATSHTNFFVNDTIRGTDGTGNTDLPEPAFVSTEPILSDGSIVTRYLVNGIEFTQRLIPTYLGDNPTVLIEYMATNTTSSPKKVGALLFLDTKIGHNDNAPISTEYGYFAVDSEFISPNIPAYWQVFEFSPWQPPESLIGGGVLVGGSATPPDRVVFGDFYRLHHTAWDYDSISGMPYDDSAMLLRWDAKWLAPEATRRMATYYGIGNVEIAIGDLNLSLSAPDELSIESCKFRVPNPFPINLLVSNTTSTAVSGLIASIALPDGFDLVGGVPDAYVEPAVLPPGGTGNVSWQVAIEETLFPHDTTLCFSVTVFNGGTDSFYVERCIDVPGNSGRGPTASLVAPEAGATFACDTLAMMFELSDPDGIDETTISLTVGDAALSYPDPARMEFSEPFLRCRVAAEEVGSGPVDIVLGDIADKNGCTLSGRYGWTIFMDWEPPNVTIIEPISGDTITDEDFRIKMDLSDPSGVDSVILRWKINGVLFDSPVNFDGGVASLEPVTEGFAQTGLTSWHVCLENIRDMAFGPCGPNDIPPVCIDFYTDLALPYGEVISPNNGEYVSCDEPEIVAALHSPSGEIDAESIRLNIGGIEYDINSPNLSFDGEMLTFNSPVTFDDGNLVEVEIRAKTESGISIIPLEWSFNIDLSSPAVTLLEPASNMFASPDEPIVFTLDDIGAGLNCDSTRFRIVTAAGTLDFDLNDVGIEIAGDTVTIWPEQLDIELEHCDTVVVHIWAEDIAGECGSNKLEDFSWSIGVPCTPPVVGAPTIANEAFVSCETLQTAIYIYDDEGMNPDVMTVSINGISVLLGGELVQYEHDSLLFTLPSSVFSRPDSLSIIAGAIEDVFGNSCEPVELLYYWDFAGPQIGELLPPDGEIIRELPLWFGAYVSDNGAGIDISNCTIEAGGVTITEAEGLTYDGERLLAPSSVLDDFVGDNLMICVNVGDLAGICDANSTDSCWTVQFDNKPPVVELLSPQSGLIIGSNPPEFVFSVTDENGVDPASIVLRAGPRTYTVADPELLYSDDKIHFSLPVDNFGHGDEITIKIEELSDAVGNHITSSVGGSWTFDFEAPAVSLCTEMPLRGPRQRLVWTIADEPAGIEWSALTVIIDDNEFPIGAPAIMIDSSSVHSGTVVFDPKRQNLDFADGAEVCIRIDDLTYECQNVQNFCQSIAMDPASPQIIKTTPEANEYISCDPLTVCALFESEFDVILDGAEVVADGPGGNRYNTISLVGDTLVTVFPEGALDEGENRIEITGLSDTLGNPFEVCGFSFVLDFAPPDVLDFWPPDGEVVSPAGLRIGAVVSDNLAGIDENELTVTITSANLVGGSRILTLADSELSLSGDSLVLDAAALDIYNDVTIELILPDKATLCGPNTLEFPWSFNISGKGPTAQLISPYDGAITHDSKQPIEIQLSDEDGVNPATIYLTVGERSWSIGPELSFDGVSLLLNPSEEWESAEELTITITAIDMLGNSSAKTLGSFITDFDPPVVDGTYPADGAFLTKSPREIRIYTSDEISGVDPSSIVVSVNEELFSWGDDALSFADGAIILDLRAAGLSWDAPDVVTVVLEELADNVYDYGTTNAITEPVEFSFTMVEESCVALPRPFTPNNDGYYDNVFIYTGIGEAARIRIYTTSGRLVREIACQGKSQWDGTDNFARPVPPGIYTYTITTIYDGRTLCGGTIVLAR